MWKHLFGPYNRNIRTEFLPEWIQYLGVYLLVGWYVLRERSLMVLSSINPGFSYRGILPGGKYEILQQFSPEDLPATVLVDPARPLQEIEQVIESAQIPFPRIIKPDAGVRGKGVLVIHSPQERQRRIVQPDFFASQVQWGDRLIQEFIDRPDEYGVFYVRYPGEEHGRITGITHKTTTSVIGDGSTTVGALVHAHPRARYRSDKLEIEHATLWETVPNAGEQVPLVEIGTHNRGSTFYDVSELICPEMEARFDKISAQVEGFFYGRYDIKVAKAEDLIDGPIKIIELNPTYSEPTHMYDPSYAYRDVLRILHQHRSHALRIAVENHKRGVAYSSLADYKQRRTIYTNHLKQ